MLLDYYDNAFDQSKMSLMQVISNVIFMSLKVNLVENCYSSFPLWLIINCWLSCLIMHVLRCITLYFTDKTALISICELSADQPIKCVYSDKEVFYSISSATYSFMTEE
jgi:succinate dehydrogenase/fumarate reductase cytochrome b subunit